MTDYRILYSRAGKNILSSDNYSFSKLDPSSVTGWGVWEVEDMRVVDLAFMIPRDLRAADKEILQRLVMPDSNSYAWIMRVAAMYLDCLDEDGTIRKFLGSLTDRFPALLRCPSVEISVDSDILRSVLQNSSDAEEIRKIVESCKYVVIEDCPHLKSVPSERTIDQIVSAAKLFTIASYCKYLNFSGEQFCKDLLNVSDGAISLLGHTTGVGAYREARCAILNSLTQFAKLGESVSDHLAPLHNMVTAEQWVKVLNPDLPNKCAVVIPKEPETEGQVSMSLEEIKEWALGGTYIRSWTGSIELMTPQKLDRLLECPQGFINADIVKSILFGV